MMLNTKEYFQNLEATPAFQELDNQTAAAIQGGAAMTLYRHANLTGDILAEFNGGGVRTMSSNANDQASSVRITEGKWKFYDARYWLDIPGAADTVELGVGNWNFVGLNDRISSFRRVG
jgi:hypothetical protein